MNKVLVFLILVVVFSCKENKKQQGNTEVDVEKPSSEGAKIIKIFENEDLAIWPKVKVELEPSLIYYADQKAYLVSRGTALEPSYLSSSPVPVTYGNTYKVSLIVKKGENSGFLGLRIAGIYPDRVDAIFDLNKGIVLGPIVAQDFENPKASIKKLDDNWYMCVLQAKVAADNIKILLGATIENINISGWEGKTNKLVSAYIVPSSILVEEIR